MMHSRPDDMNVAIDTVGLRVNSAVVGEMVAAYLRRNASVDVPHLAKGLPNDVCCVPHWGYVLEGSVIFDYEDGTQERAHAGEVFYCPQGPPGHVYHYDEDARIIEFSPLDQMIPVAEQMNKNLADG